jgi:exonuclease VII small subunit
MKKFMKIAIGIVAKLAFFAIVCATAYGVAHLWDTTGLVVLLGAVLLGWIIVGLVPDKKACLFAEMQISLATAEAEVIRMKAEMQNALQESETLVANLEEAKLAIEGAQSEYEAVRQELAECRKELREKQGEVAYWRSKYDQAVDSVVEEAVSESEPDDVEVATSAPEIARHRPIRKRRLTKPSKA